MKSQFIRPSHHNFQLSLRSEQSRILSPESYDDYKYDVSNLRKNHQQKASQLALLLLSSCLELMLWQQTVPAQIIPDNTLGAEGSIVTPQNLRDLIEGGAIRDTNLFHSFTEFSINEGQNVYFANPEGIVNILTRVTGANASDILGTLGVDGAANLILINPNGINFGSSAQLDVAGSFLATTADSVIFENGLEFSATNPEAPPLLTINIPLGLQYGQNPGAITNQSVAQDSNGNTVGLQVQPGQTLALVGGEVAFNGGVARSPDARIEIGAVGSNALVNLTSTDTGYVLGYEGVEAFADITFNQSAFVETSGEGGGSIQLQGRNITLSDGSLMFADTLGSQNGGGILINSEQLVIEDGSFVASDVFGAGQGGNLNITTSQLLVEGGAQVSASTLGEGDGGNLIVNATDSVQVIGTSTDGQFFSGLGAQVGSNSTGNAGDLTITTSQLLIQGGARVDASTFGLGNGGNSIINASESVQVIGRSANGQTSSSLGSQATPGSTGNAGDLTITTSQLLVEGGAQISARTLGEGDGGNLIVNSTDSVQVIGTSTDGQFFSALSAQAGPNSTGNSGDLTINTAQLLIQNAQVDASTFGAGDGGSLTVNASESVQMLVTSTDRQFFSNLAAQAAPNSTGNAGDLTITTAQLLLEDGAQISASTFGAGDGGSLTVNASDSVQVFGESADGQFSSSLFVNADLNSTGDAGDLTITTTQLLIQDRAEVGAATVSIGDGGDLIVNASESVQVINATLSTQATSISTGDAGDLTITTTQLLIQDGGQVDANTFGAGDGGNLIVNASESVQVIGESADGQFFSNLATQANPNSTGNAGDLSINTTQLSIQEGAQVDAGTSGTGDGGNLIVNASDSVQVFGESFLTVQSDTNSTAGNLTIITPQLTAQENSTISVSSPSGQAGNLEITSNNLSLNNSEITAETALSGEEGGANILLQIADLLILENESLISATANNQANGGNVTINSGLLVAFPPTGDSGSDIQANAFQGDGGRVNITADSIFGIEFRDNVTPDNDITVTSVEGSAGIVEIDTPDTNPAEGLTSLPAAPVNPQPIRGCQAKGGQSTASLVDRGRGGLPPNPYKPLSNADIWEDFQPPHQVAQNTSEPIVEAQGWKINERGNVELIAEASSDSAQLSCSSS